MSVVGAIEPSLRDAEIERVKRKRPGSLDAYDLVLRAIPPASAPRSATPPLHCRANGILLRADIHAIFDALLITLTPEGRGIEVSSRLIDPSYEFLKHAQVHQPSVSQTLSSENIQNHRQRFYFEQRRASSNGH